jgi:hypothetical protein
MEEKIEDRIYFVTHGIFDGKVRTYNRGDIWAAYAAFIYGTGVLFTYILLRDSGSFEFVIIMSIFVLTLLYLSFTNGRKEAKKFIKEYEGDLLKEAST